MGLKLRLNISAGLFPGLPALDCGHKMTNKRGKPRPSGRGRIAQTA